MKNKKAPDGGITGFFVISGGSFFCLSIITF